MFGGVSADILLEIAKRNGWMEQTSFDFPPVIYINPEYATDVPVSYCFDSMSTLSYVDHPSFTALRNTLESKGYIKTERSWCNGDVVLKPFFLNRLYFKANEQFPCAAAIKHRIKHGIFSTVSDHYLKEETNQQEYIDTLTIPLF